ncbi:uncharacterized protein LOC128557086 [Mercenaria mercenaria]|uniref:uncharacterized protein LOC128557086 n=1 Tax=Mercenaria mercenaria TaxID=6596 RepID=UPI00234E4EC1|nr:uncharacterized protein LOC128557086 [Mercenaria mercenaria]
MFCFLIALCNRIERNEMFKLNNEFMKEKEHLWNSLVQKEKEVDELRTRLSRVASERLTDNNPNVADLSDQNRPVKIADRYTEVYSNEWSDAFEDLVATGDRTEQEAIKILLEFIENIYNMCLNISTNNAKDLNTNILLFTGHIFRGADMKISTNLSSAMKPFKDERKLMYKEFLPTLCTETNKLRDIKLVKKKDRTKKLQKYLDTATELCWLMCIQDPPVHLYTDCKQGHKFDENNFSAFTVRGTTVDYLVWPALHLCQNGPILKKGVAQAKATNKENRQKIKPNSSRNSESQCHDQNAQSLSF